MNVSNGVWLDTYIIKIISKTIKNADKFYKAKWDFKDIKFPVKVSDIHKLEIRTPSKSVFMVMKRRKNIQSVCHKNVVEINMLIH